MEFGSLIQLTTSIQSCDSSTRFTHSIRCFVNNLSTQQLGPAECAKRLNPPPAPQGRAHGVSDHRVAVAEVAKGAKILAEVLCILLQIFFGGGLFSPYNPPRGPAHSAGLTQEAHGGRLGIDRKLGHFLDSIFDRFWVVVGRQVGVVLNLFGNQVRPSSVQNASWKLINIKNVNCHQTLRPLAPERISGCQGGL